MRAGTFTKADQTVTYYYNKFEGAVGKVTVKYMRAGDEAFGMAAQEIASSVTIEGREGTAYTTTVKAIDGFELDLENFLIIRQEHLQVKNLKWFITIKLRKLTSLL